LCAEEEMSLCAITRDVEGLKDDIRELNPALVAAEQKSQDRAEQRQKEKNTSKNLLQECHAANGISKM
jgi:hypothetical protein